MRLEKPQIDISQDALFKSALPKISTSQELATVESALKELDARQFGILANEAGKVMVFVALFRERVDRFIRP